MFKSTLLSIALLFSFTGISFAQQSSQQRPQNVPPAAQPAAQPTPAPVPDEPPVVTKHEIRLDERTIKYTVTTGMMPIKNQVSGETEARMFFMAYTLDGVSDPSKRPLMFSFNGGPGSSSVWLHLGALGPKRVKMQDDGMMPAPPYQLVTNEHHVARSDRPGVHRPGRHRLQPRGAAGAGEQISGSERRPRLGRRIHQDVSDTERALGVAALSGRRELRNDARFGAVGAARSIAASPSTAFS